MQGVVCLRVRTSERTLAVCTMQQVHRQSDKVSIRYSTEEKEGVGDEGDSRCTYRYMVPLPRLIPIILHCYPDLESLGGCAHIVPVDTTHSSHVSVLPQTCSRQGWSVASRPRPDQDHL